MCQHTNASTRLVRRMAANGSWQIFRQCMVCGANWDGRFVGKPAGWEMLPEVAAIDALRCDYHGCNRPAEYHHIMPRAIARKFNELPDHWPMVKLCRVHHELWHAILTPGLLD